MLVMVELVDLMPGIDEGRAIEGGMERKTESSEHQRKPMYPFGELPKGTLEDTRQGKADGGD
jgi:hypothetical protein